MYLPLDSAKRSIRLLTLHPSNDYCEDPVCSLSTFDLAAAPPFYAISYLWGDQSQWAWITLNGFRVKVGRNAHNALAQLRDLREIEIIWMDCICINQEDVQERNNQVSLMAYIFENALFVIHWLGEGSKFDHAAFRAICGMYELTKDHSSKSWRQMSLENILEDEPVQLVERFFRNQFWHRVWIAQELALGSRGRIIHSRHGFISGKEVLPAGMLRKALDVTIELAARRYLRADAKEIRWVDGLNLSAISLLS